MRNLTVMTAPPWTSDGIVAPAPVGAELLPIFKALADGSRLAILRLIAAQAEPLCACEIVDRFDLGQPTIAHHLRVLREAGLITAERRGVWVHYALDAAGLTIAADFIQGLTPARPAPPVAAR